MAHEEEPGVVCGIVALEQAVVAFGLPEDALAIACGSHAGEKAHVDVVRQTLKAIGCSVDHLLCGAHRPWSRHSVRPGQTPLENNCSGKHALMLAACKAKGWDIATYQAPDHPLQEATNALLQRATGRDELPTGRDGCGVPTWFLPVIDLAKAFSWLNQHGQRALDAIAAHPKMVSGTDQFCTDLAVATQGAVIGKYGALGVYGAVHRPTGEALAVKLVAGHEKPAKAVAAAIMADTGWISDAQAQALSKHMQPPNMNNCGEQVGALRVQL